MQEVTRDALVSITGFAAVFGMVYIYIMTRHRERMAILERNLSSVPFKTTPSSHVNLKYGLFLVGIGLGFVFGSLAYNHLGMEEGAAYISMTCLCGGIGLIVSYLIIEKQRINTPQ